MRRDLLFLLLLAVAVPLARGQDKIVEMFDGSATQTTGTFVTQDKWELRWHGASAMTITVVNGNGTIVAGTGATADGSLYQPAGGSFYLQIVGAPAANTPTWHVDVVQLGPASSAASVSAYVPPVSLPPPGKAPSGLTTPDLTLTNAPPSPPVAAAVPAAGTAHVSDTQAHAIVLVRGDEGVGTGFLTHDANGTPVVVTNHHVLFDNPNVRITTTEGRDIPVLAYRGATDRDLIMMTIKDDHYSYLDTARNVDQLVHADDAVLTPGNSEGGGVVLDTSGVIRAIGPSEVEISNPFFHGNSGGPVLHVASGKVVGVVTRFELVRPSDLFDAASLANPNSAINGKTRYFAVRLDTVPAWEDYDLTRFMTETTFLHDFHKRSRLLDSLLNGARYEKAGLSTEGDEGYLPNAHLYQEDEQLAGLMDTYHQQTRDTDNSQQMDADRELFSALGDYAAVNMTEIAKPENFYQFDRLRAKTEIEYRQHLIDELGKVGDRIGDLGH